MYPEIPNRNRQQMRAYREMSDDQLFRVEWVEVAFGPEDLPGYKQPAVICE